MRLAHSMSDEDPPVVQPPDTMTVWDDGPDVVLWTPDGEAVTRQQPIGFLWQMEGD